MATLLDLRFDDPLGSGSASDVGGSTAEDGTYTGDAAPDGNGLATFDGAGDYVEVAADPIFGLSEGTVVVTFTQNSASSSNIPYGADAAKTLFSVDSNSFDGGGHLTIFVRADGSVGVRHQDSTSNYNFSGGSVTLGQQTTVAYSWGPSGSTLVVDGVVVDAGTDALVMAGDVEPIVIGASQAQSGNGVANNIQGEFDGTIDRVILTDTALGGAVRALCPERSSKRRKVKKP